MLCLIIRLQLFNLLLPDGVFIKLKFFQNIKNNYFA